MVGRAVPREELAELGRVSRRAGPDLMVQR